MAIKKKGNLTKKEKYGALIMILLLKMASESNNVTIDRGVLQKFLTENVWIFTKNMS